MGYTYELIPDLKKDGLRAPRKLPAESWQVQPPVEGHITDCITIFMNGKGNAARVLRVEGFLETDSGRVLGFYEKSIFEESWKFVGTGAKSLTGNVIDKADPTKETEAVQDCCQEKEYKGIMEKLFHWDQEVVVANFKPYCSPAQLIFRIEKRPFELPVHTRRVHFHKRKNAYTLDGTVDTRALREASNTAASALADRFFGKKTFFFFRIRADENKMKLSETRYGLKRLFPGAVSMTLERSKPRP
jgi:hypothetical protein